MSGKMNRPPPSSDARKRNALRWVLMVSGVVVVLAALAACAAEVINGYRMGEAVSTAEVLTLVFLLLAVAVGVVHGKWAAAQREGDRRRQNDQALHEADAKMRLVFDAVADAIIVTDIDSAIRQANSAALSMFGYDSQSDAIGLLALDFVVKDERERARADWARTLAGGSVVGQEYAMVGNSGQKILAEITCNALRDPKGLTTAIIIVAQDVTGRREAERELRQSQEKYAMLVEQGNDGIVIIQDGIVKFANARALMTAGCSLSEIVGKPFVSFVSATSGGKVAEAYARRLTDSGGTNSYEIEILRPGGQMIPAEVSASRIEYEGRPASMAIIRDITERKQAAKALEDSRAYLKNVFDSVLAGMVVIDAETRTIADINDLAARIIGHQKDRIIGAPCNRYICSEDGEVCPVHDRWLTVDNVECRLKTADGRKMDVLKSIVPIARNGREQFLETFVDITEHRRAEEMYHTLASSSPIGVYVAQDGKFRFVNPQFRKILGYSESELLGMNPLNIVHREDREMVRQRAIQMLKSERAAPYEFRAAGKNGDTVWALENVTSIMYKGRKATLGNFTDITERKKMEEQLIRSDRLASIGELASGIAHELNNPLTGVIAFSQLLMDGDIPENIKEDLTMVCTEAQRAAGIVKNLLTFARKHPTVRHPTKINDAIDEVLKLRAYEEKVNNIDVHRVYDPELPDVVADYFQLQQVFLNVVVNAEFFMIQAHNKGNLTITTEKVDGHVRVSFADDGPGIPSKNLTRIFDPFFTTKEVGKGTGLGLSICHGIITEHGGHIWAASEPGRGATITMELPLYI